MLWACGLSSGLNPAVHSHAALFGLGFPLLLLLNIAFIFFWLVFTIRICLLLFLAGFFHSLRLVAFCRNVAVCFLYI